MSNNAGGAGGAVYWFEAPEYDVERLKEGLGKLPGLFPEMGGGSVLLKPNLLGPKPPESAVCTHPVFVEAVASLFVERGYRVTVGDSPGYASLKATLRKAGYSDFMERLGIEAADLSEGVERSGRFFKKIRVARAAVEADAVINLPKLKTHGATGLTLAVKNLFGCVPGLLKAHWHLATGHDAGRFALLLLDLAEVVRPHYSLLDGVVGMDGRGPSAGRVRDIGVVFGSKDAPALDLAAAEYLGAGIDCVTTLRYAEEFLGKPLPSPRVISVESGAEEKPERLRDFDLIQPDALLRPYLFPRGLWGLFRKLVSPYPLVSVERCVGCGACAGICPVQTISIAEPGRGPAVIDYGPCIRCFCCEEVCPERAIRPKVPLLGRMLR